jgi:hypothetical protein
MGDQDILGETTELAAFIRYPHLKIRPACCRPNMAKSCLATDGKDLLGTLKPTGRCCALAHGVDLWSIFAQARPRRLATTQASTSISYLHAVNPNGGVFSFIAYVDSKRSLCCN